jgi:hypothetical protein
MSYGTRGGESQWGEGRGGLTIESLSGGELIKTGRAESKRERECW